MPRGQYDRTAGRAMQGSDEAIPQPPVPVAELPARVRLLEAHGFINEYDAVYQKPQGAIITNPVEIAMLIGRGAALEEF